MNRQDDARRQTSIDFSEGHLLELDELFPKQQNHGFLSPAMSRISLGQDTLHSTATLPLKPRQEECSRRLRRSTYIVWLVLLYSFLSVFAWVMTCYLSRRPIGAPDYLARFNGSISTTHPIIYIESSRWLRAARYCQTVINVLTIPLASAVCSSAAVIYVQKRRASEFFNLSVRQVMTLADKIWTSPAVCMSMVFSRHLIHRTGSNFLLFAILVNLFGASIAPIQELFVSQKTIKTPLYPIPLATVPDLFPVWQEAEGSNYAISLMQDYLEAATSLDQEELLWADYNGRCGGTGNSTHSAVPCSSLSILGNITQLDYPFLAQLPNSVDTGLIQQFIPRINSSTAYERIGSTDVPVECGFDSQDLSSGLPGAYAELLDPFFNASSGPFRAAYGGTTSGLVSNVTWRVDVCIHDHFAVTFVNTRDRQDFFQALYINVKLNQVSFFQTPANSSSNLLYSLSANTTTGYFELPNEMNGHLPGPLLEKDPGSAVCGENCLEEFNEDQARADWNYLPPLSNVPRGPQPENPWLPIPLRPSPGPLSCLAEALFGNTSFFAQWVHNTQQPSLVGPPDDERICDPEHWILPSICADAKNFQFYGPEQVVLFLGWLGPTTDSELSDTVTILSAAMFLTNKAWLLATGIPTEFYLQVSYDMGADTQIPVISWFGIILNSSLLGVYLMILLGTAVYSASTPRWTSTLDSFAMMRYGAWMADQVPFLMADSENAIEALDSTPGFIGDDTEDETIGLLIPGGQGGVRGGRRYAAYEGQHEAPKQWRNRRYKRGWMKIQEEATARMKGWQQIRGKKV